MNKGEGEKRFNEHCLRVFFKWEGKNSSFLISSKLGSFEGGGGRSGSTYLKKKIVKFTIMMSI